MQPIFYGVAILAACGAAFFSYSHLGKLKALEVERVETILAIKDRDAATAVADQGVKEQRTLLTESKGKREELDQKVSFLSSVGVGLNNDMTRLESELKVQDDEFAQLKSALDEVNLILVDLGGGVTLETLAPTIEGLQTEKLAKEKQLEEIEELLGGAEKSLAGSRAELESATRRLTERTARIGRNAMESVITAVDQNWGFVVIGAGSNSGFTPQATLLVRRDGRKIGSVRPSSIEPTQTIAEIDMKSLAPGVRIQPGDRVILAKPASN